MANLHEQQSGRNTRSMHDLFLDNIPKELKQRRQWVCFKLGRVKEDGKRTKMPLNPRDGTPAAINDASTWGTFEEAVAAYFRGVGNAIGYAITAADPYVGVDADNCRDPKTGRLTLLGDCLKSRGSHNRQWLSSSCNHNSLWSLGTF